MIDLNAAFFIQKDHESNEYWREMVGTQVSDLHKQIHGLQGTIGSMNEIIDQMAETLKTQNMLLDQLTKKC